MSSTSSQSSFASDVEDKDEDNLAELYDMISNQLQDRKAKRVAERTAFKKAALKEASAALDVLWKKHKSQVAEIKTNFDSESKLLMNQRTKVFQEIEKIQSYLGPIKEQSLLLRVAMDERLAVKSDEMKILISSLETLFDQK